MKTSRQSSSFLAELIDFFNAVQSWGLKRIHAAGWFAVVILFAGGIISWASTLERGPYSSMFCRSRL